ncbi:hypothetical protein ABZ401_19070 [Streptomyces sp. NPDC005892]|uniref:hypothetical protein n=1 Tax=Streptomyces sp. NPDC005892 TaxID=3155593 RepID=UPI0033F6107F
MTDFDQADIAAMNREGDLHGFMRAQLRAGLNRKSAPPAPPPKPPGHQPGAWPTGTRPSEAEQQHHPPAAWEQALVEYRDWLTTANHAELKNPHDNRQKCGCATCTPRRTA